MHILFRFRHDAGTTGNITAGDVNQRLDVFRGLRTAVRQVSHLLRDDGEPFAVIARPRRLNRRVKRRGYLSGMQSRRLGR